MPLKPRQVNEALDRGLYSDGGKPVYEITAEDVLFVLSPFWTEKTETAKRVHGWTCRQP
ncbi:MAG: hypothetical protein ABR578_09745 [Chromatocurvus sp.]